MAGAVSATTIPVTPTTGIQNAVSSTSTHDGDSLSLNGYYKENSIRVMKNLTITGPKTSSTPTIIDAQNQGRVFNIASGHTVTLKYLTIMNGNASKDISKMDGGGIQNWNSNLILINCTLINNHANYGGAIYNAYSGTVKIYNSSITNNDATTSGGGICNDHGGKLTVTSSKINHNYAIDDNIVTNTDNYGGGIYNNDGSICTINSQSVIENNQGDSGGGIYNSGICTVIDSTMNYNGATSAGAGIHNEGSCTISISNIKYNFANYGGSGVYNTGNCTVSNTSIYSNTGEWCYGAGLCNIKGGNCTIMNSIINNNGGNCGGGIENGGNCSIFSSNINNNLASSNSGGQGGGIWNNGNLLVNDCNIKNNTADAGAGIYNCDSLTVIGCNFNGNLYSDAIYNEGGDTSNRVIMFNRFNDSYSNKIYSQCEIYSQSGEVRATMNWWGSNANPANKIIAVTGTVYASQWLILTINATKTIINKSVTSTITADLNHYKTSTGSIIPIDPAVGHVMNGIPIIFKTNKGSINSPVKLVNGVAKATLTSGTFSGNGTANVTATLDGQTVYKYIKIDTVAPTIASISPANGATGVPRNKIIYVTFSEQVKWASKWIEIQANGVIMPSSAYTLTLSSDGKTLTIKPVTGTLWKANTTYTVIFHTGCVTDIAGNNLALTSRSFKTIS